MTEAYVMFNDRDLMFETNISVERYDKTNRFDTNELWYPKGNTELGTNLLAYKTMASITKPKEYDLFPSEGNLVIASQRLKDLFSDNCDASEFGAYPCEIVNRKEKINAWTIYPTFAMELVDHENSVVDWFKSSVEHAPPILMNSKQIRFKQNCLGSYNFVRWKEAHAYLVVSKKLKNAIQTLNPRGARFLKDSELQFNNGSYDWKAVSTMRKQLN